LEWKNDGVIASVNYNHYNNNYYYSNMAVYGALITHRSRIQIIKS